MGECDSFVIYSIALLLTSCSEGAYGGDRKSTGTHPRAMKGPIAAMEVSACKELGGVGWLHKQWWVFSCGFAF